MPGHARAINGPQIEDENPLAVISLGARPILAVMKTKFASLSSCWLRVIAYRYSPVIPECRLHQRKDDHTAARLPNWPKLNERAEMYAAIQDPHRDKHKSMTIDKIRGEKSPSLIGTSPNRRS